MPLDIIIIIIVVVLTPTNSITALAVVVPDDSDRCRVEVRAAVGAAAGVEKCGDAEDESGDADDEAGEDQDRRFARGRRRGWSRVEEFGRRRHCIVSAYLVKLVS